MPRKTGEMGSIPGSVLCIPVVSVNAKTSTTVLEKLGYYYYYDVMPEYYDVILKNKYRRDSSDAASQIIDLIHDSMTTDFAYIYNYGMSNMMLSLPEIVSSQRMWMPSACCAS